MTVMPTVIPAPLAPAPSPAPVVPAAPTPPVGTPETLVVNGQTYKVADLIAAQNALPSAQARARELETQAISLFNAQDPGAVDTALESFLGTLPLDAATRDRHLRRPEPAAPAAPAQPSAELTAALRAAQTAVEGTNEAKLIFLDQQIRSGVAGALADPGIAPLVAAITRVAGAEHFTKTAGPSLQNDIYERTLDLVNQKFLALPTAQRRLDYNWVEPALRQAILDVAKRNTSLWGDPNVVGKAPQVEAPYDALLRKPALERPTFGDPKSSKPEDYIRDRLQRADAALQRPAPALGQSAV